jgi:hypothetical protein
MPKNKKEGSGPAVVNQDTPVERAHGSWRFNPGGYSPPEPDPKPRDRPGALGGLLTTVEGLFGKTGV